jgi:TPP-dependent pyruvate/acetoin dehydrogenase alpha subunit
MLMTIIIMWCAVVRYNMNRKDNDHPMSRLRLLLESRSLWDADKERIARAEATTAVRAALSNAESMPLSSYFTCMCVVNGGM